MTDFTPPLHASKHCRHYSFRLDGGNTGPTCAAGVAIDGIAVGACMPEPNEPCPSRADYTEAERAAWAAWRDERSARLALAIQALPQAIPLNSTARVVCPNCGGQLACARWHRGAELSCTTAGCCGARFNIAAGADWPSRK